MTIQIRTASRKKAKLRLGIAAPSGAGKTAGALLLAFGIVGDWSKIGFIDSEKGSGELYVGQTFDTVDGPVKIGEYMYCQIEPEYTVNKYTNALKAMEEAGAEIVIQDSISHAWASAGGLLDKQAKIAAKSGNSYTAWRDVTPDHDRFVDAMLSSPSHIIATMRSKQEYVLETNDKGKQVPKKVGMAPVQREGMEYEFTVMLDIDMKHMASSSKDRTNLFNDKYFQITHKTGQLLKNWLELGVEPEKPLEDQAKEFVVKINNATTITNIEKINDDNKELLLKLKESKPEYYERVMLRNSQAIEAINMANKPKGEAA